MLMTRILSAAVLAPLVLLAIYFGGLWFAALVILAAGLMGWEWARMCNGGRLGISGGIAIAVLALLPPAFLFVSQPLAALAVLFLGAVVAQSMGALRGERQKGWLLLGTIYVGLGCLSFLWLRYVPEEGLNLVFWLLAVVWATDIGAYFAGRGIGGPKLAPRISPNKTWAGLFGGMIAAGLVGAVAAGLLDRDATLPVVGGMLLAVVAQAGDLLESWCKRRFGVKDSSHIIPGHGGILDRVDGLLSVLPVAFLYFWAMGASF
jgi:phosphatidate cytidylyltransferase